MQYFIYLSGFIFYNKPSKKNKIQINGNIIIDLFKNIVGLSINALHIIFQLL